jgi:threonine/homoserine/homoserine lactone efflux protein
MTWLAIVAASEGRWRGLAAVAGVALGLSVLGVAAAFGFAAIVSDSPLIYEGLRYAGALVLLDLAWEGWSKPASGVTGSDGDGLLRYFWRGFVTNIVNPKALLFYITVLPTFARAGGDGIGEELTLTAVYVAVATAVHAVIVALAGTLAPLLNDPRREGNVRRVLSVLLAAVAVWFFFSTAR